jgi:hypothetical protein
LINSLNMNASLRSPGDDFEDTASLRCMFTPTEFLSSRFPLESVRPSRLNQDLKAEKVLSKRSQATTFYKHTDQSSQMTY